MPRRFHRGERATADRVQRVRQRGGHRGRSAAERQPPPPGWIPASLATERLPPEAENIATKDSGKNPARRFILVVARGRGSAWRHQAEPRERIGQVSMRG